MGPRGALRLFCGFQIPGEDREVVPAGDIFTDCFKGLQISFHTL